MDTFGGLVDKLSIVNLRIWMAEDIKRDPKATDEQLAKATKITNVANQQRSDLVQEMDEMLNEMILTGKVQKLYSQGKTKMYGKQ